MSENASPPTPERLEDIIETFFAMSNTMLRMDRIGGHCRLRYTRTDPETEMSRREAVELPADEALADRMDEAIRHRREMMDNEAASPKGSTDTISSWTIAAAILTPGIRLATQRFWPCSGRTVAESHIKNKPENCR